LEVVMAHPHHEHRQHKVEKSRVAHITRGYATGGAVHGDEAHGGAEHQDEAADKKLFKKMIRKERDSLAVEGSEAKERADKPSRRAKGGRTKARGNTVNVIVAGSGGGRPPMPAPVVAGGPPVAPPAMPPRPPMAPPGAMPPGGPPMGPPGMIRRDGGRAYAKGGAVKDGPAWKEGVRSGTQVQHAPGKQDLKDIGRGPPITYARGGAIEASNKVERASMLPGGAGGGEARLAKEHRAERNYKRA